MSRTPVISWTNQDFDTICPDCGIKYLNANNLDVLRTINTTESKNCPELLRAVWNKDDYAEILYTAGYPPKCFYCGFYIMGYNVLCLKNSKRNKDCGCKECKPFLYKRQR